MKENTLNSILLALGGFCGVYLGFNILKFVSLHFFCYNDLKCYGANKGKWVLVTGASAGIGEAFVLELAKRGMNVILVARSEKLLEDLSQKVQKKYHIQTLVIPADCGKVEESINKIATATENLPLTMLINNVGVEFGEPSPFLEKTNDQVNGMIDINIRFTTLITMKLLPNIIQNTLSSCRGAVINVASVAHNVAPPLVAVYSGTKSYTTTYSKSLSSELRTHHPEAQIDVLCIRPGFVETKMSGLIANSLKGFLLQVVTASTFVRCSLDLLGYVDDISPYWGHDLQTIFMTTFIPRFLLEKFLYSRSFVRYSSNLVSSNKKKNL